MIHSNTIHPGKTFRPFSFGDTISTITTPRLFTPPPPAKYYTYFQIVGEISHAAQCAKSRTLIKFLKEIFDIESFEQQFVIIKELLQFKKR